MPSINLSNGNSNLGGKDTKSILLYYYKLKVIQDLYNFYLKVAKPDSYKIIIIK